MKIRFEVTLDHEAWCEARRARDGEVQPDSMAREVVEALRGVLGDAWKQLDITILDRDSLWVEDGGR